MFCFVFDKTSYNGLLADSRTILVSSGTNEKTLINKYLYVISIHSLFM